MNEIADIYARQLQQQAKAMEHQSHSNMQFVGGPTCICDVYISDCRDIIFYRDLHSPIQNIGIKPNRHYIYYIIVY